MLDLGFSTSTLQTWTVALIGGGATGLTLFLGLVLIGRRRKVDQPRVKEPSGQADPFVHGSATEKRISLRRQGNPIKVLISNEEATNPPEEGWVLDRSIGGLCLQVDRQAIPSGTILSVRASNAPKSVPWTQLEVRSCRQEGSSWELGCQFLKTPSWNVLLLFG